MEKPPNLFLRQIQIMGAFMARAISIKNTKNRRKSKEPDEVPGAEFLAQVDRTGQRWDENKTTSRSVGRAYHNAGGLAKLADRVSKCAQFLGFVRAVTPEGEVVQRLDMVSFCKARFCPVCQWRKSLFWVSRFKKALPAITAAHPTGRWIMLTVTVKNCDVSDLRKNLNDMSLAWRKMTRRDEWPALGFVRSLEITRNAKTGQAHPHYHALLHVPAGYFGGRSFRPQAWWAEQWRTALGVDYTPTVDVRAAKAKDGFSPVESACVEVLKYAVKASDLTACPAWLVGATEATKSVRYLSTGGTLKDCIKEQVSEEDMRDTDTAEDDKETEQNLGHFVFEYWPDFKRYGRNTHPRTPPN